MSKDAKEKSRYVIKSEKEKADKSSNFKLTLDILLSFSLGPAIV